MHIWLNEINMVLVNCSLIICCQVVAEQPYCILIFIQLILLSTLKLFSSFENNYVSYDCLVTMYIKYILVMNFQILIPWWPTSFTYYAACLVMYGAILFITSWSILLGMIQSYEYLCITNHANIIS